MKRGETTVRRKWLPPAAAPGWPACRPDSSRSSMDCGSSPASRSRIAVDRSISESRLFPHAPPAPAARGAASPGLLLFLDVAGEEQCLQQDEQEHQTHSAEKLEIDPGIGGKVVSDVEIGRAHERKEGCPAPVEARPPSIARMRFLRNSRSAAAMTAPNSQ